MGRGIKKEVISNQSAQGRSARRILATALGILVIVGMMIIAYVYMRGVVAGIVVAGCIIALFWMSRSMRRKR